MHLRLNKARFTREQRDHINHCTYQLVRLSFLTLVMSLFTLLPHCIDEIGEDALEVVFEGIVSFVNSKVDHFAPHCSDPTAHNLSYIYL
jgi:hypothetical protein